MRPIRPTLRIEPLFLHHSKQRLYIWMRRIGHPPSGGGTLPRNTSFIINGAHWAVDHGLKAVEVCPHYQGKKHQAPSLWCGTWVIFLSDCWMMFNSTLTLDSVFVFPSAVGVDTSKQSVWGIVFMLIISVLYNSSLQSRERVQFTPKLQLILSLTFNTRVFHYIVSLLCAWVCMQHTHSLFHTHTY